MNQKVATGAGWLCFVAGVWGGSVLGASGAVRAEAILFVLGLVLGFAFAAPARTHKAVNGLCFFLYGGVLGGGLAHDVRLAPSPGWAYLVALMGFLCGAACGRKYPRPTD